MFLYLHRIDDVLILIVAGHTEVHDHMAIAFILQLELILSIFLYLEVFIGHQFLVESEDTVN